MSSFTSNILVTGATGLLGKTLIEQLASKPTYSVRALVRNTQNNLTANVEQVIGDILDINSLDTALKGIDYVIHAAAYISFNSRKQNILFETNVEGTKNLINACIGLSLKKFVHISSVAAIGKPDSVLDAKTEVVIDEDYKWQDSPINSNYGKSKYLAELEVWRGQAEGIPTIIINPSVILGEGNLNKSSSQLFKYVLNEIPFYTGGYLNHVDVRDVASITLNLMEGSFENERFIASAGKVSLIDFFTKTAVLLNKKPPRILLGKLLINVLWRLEYLRGLIFRTDPLITKETAISARSNIRFHGQKVKDNLNFSYKDIDSSLKRISEYVLTLKKH